MLRLAITNQDAAPAAPGAVSNSGKIYVYTTGAIVLDFTGKFDYDYARGVAFLGVQFDSGCLTFLCTQPLHSEQFPLLPGPIIDVKNRLKRAN